MARRIRWQLVIAFLSALMVGGLLGRLALRTASVANPLAGGVYVEALVGTPQTPLPLLNDPVADPLGRDLIALLYDGLLRIGADGLLEPALAQSYDLDPTGTSYIFRLRSDVFWHDGQPFTADDVVFTLRALQVLEQPGEPALAAFWQDLLVDRLDAQTVRVTLNEPLAAFPSLARVPMLPAHLLVGQVPTSWATSSYAQQLIGTGPYRLRELRPDRAILEANPAYYSGSPFIQRLELRFLTTREAAQGALARGEVTAFGERLRLDAATASTAPDLRTVALPLDEYAILSFNLDHPELAQAALRRALAHGLDKDALIEQALEGTVARLDTPILPGSWAFSPAVRWYEPDQATATELLSELGYVADAAGSLGRAGTPLAFELLVDADPRRQAAATAIAQQWGELGLNIRVVELDGPGLLARLRSGDFSMALHSWTRLGPDPDPFPLWHSFGGLNYSGLHDENIDQLLANARYESELAVRSADYAAFQERWVELVPSITLYQPLYRFSSDQQLGGTGMGDPASPSQPILFGAEDRYRNATRWFTASYREIQGDVQ